ncbi:hypothetical protein C2W62_25215 [Candidatus Entotheonella serta]|nr:hypothetical protein C2W62_25215 [Candidatus Entotheonella serta]
MRQTQAGDVATFASTCNVTQLVRQLTAMWTGLLQRYPSKPRTDWTAFSRYTARELTRQQCLFFDHIIGESAYVHVPSAA